MQARSRVIRPQAPRPPEGWQVGPPDYVGVGTARSGTSWWDQLILAHPGVARAPGNPKEVHFFDDLWDRGLRPVPGAATTAGTEGSAAWGGQTVAGGEAQGPDVAVYHAFFARPPGKLAGEWTPGYMLDVWTPSLLRRAAPQARLIVLLENPVERFRSGRTLAENRLTVGSTARAAANAAFNRGLYADQLLRLWSSFPREQVLVLQYERCVRATGAELRRTYAFLGLDPDVADRVDVGVRVNESRGPKVTLGAWQEDMLVRRYAPENERLARLLPQLDMGLWRRPGDGAAGR